LSFDIVGFLSTVFLGEQTNAWSYLPAVALRVVILYFFSYFILRLMGGKRSNKQITIFDAVVIVALGNIIGNPTFDFAVPLIWPMLILFVFLLVEQGFIRLVQYSRGLSAFIESEPAMLVKDGLVDFERVHKERLGTEELYSELRQQGVKSLGEVERTYLEEAGGISVFRAAKTTKGLCLFPEEPGTMLHRHIGELVEESKDYSCWKCGKTILFLRDEKFTFCPRCKGKEWGKTAEP
jgi:uncharacterized membrane protein YcaP (DUF421 family)